jgi:hypothetical protein
MKSLKRIIAVFITIKRIASAFLLLTLLIVGLSAQERHEGSARRSRAHTSRPKVKKFRLADTYRLSFYDRTPDSASVPANWFVGEGE